MFRNLIVLCFLLLTTGGAPAFSGESVTEWNPRPRKNCSKLERLPCSIRVSGAEAHVMSVKSFEIRAGKRYRVSGSFRSAQKNVPFYMGILPLDARGESFGGSEACPVPGSDTRLIADVKPGDRIMKVADASKWAMRSGSFAAFGIKADYSDLPNRDLSRGPVTHIEQNPATKEWEITFRLPFRKTYAKGTAVRQHIGPQYQYLVSGKKLSEEWQEFSGIFSGTPMSAETGFRRGVYPGTESVRLVLFVPGAKRTFEFKEIKITAME